MQMTLKIDTPASSADLLITENSTFSYGLRSAVLSPLEILGQSVAGIAPTAMPALTMALVFGLAGNGSWLVYLIATVLVIFTAMNINQFASRSSSPGSLYSYSVLGLGSGFGILTGWALLCAYVVVTTLCLYEVVIFTNAIFVLLGGFALSPIIILLGCAIAAAAFSYKNIKLSAELTLWLELVSMFVIAALVAVTLSKHGLAIDVMQLKLQGVHLGGLNSGLVLAILGFVGFESAASLGAEARHPQTTIPRAIIQSAILAGVFFVITSYAMVLGFAGSVIPLDKCSTPLVVLAKQAGIPSLGLLTTIGAAVSFFAATLAMINAGARILFTMAKHGIFHPSLGASHNRNQTPHVAILIVTGVSLLLAIALNMTNHTLMDIISWTGTFSTYGFMVAYMAVSVAAPVYLRRHHKLRPIDVVISAISVIAMMVALIGTVYPVPPAPYNWLPYLFVLYLAIGVGWYRLSQSRVSAHLRKSVE